MGGGARALHLQRAARGVDSRRLRLRRAARDRRDRVSRRLFVPALLRQDPGAADRERHRRRGVLLLHVLLGRTAARAHAHLGQRQANIGHHDAHGFSRGHGLGTAGGRRRVDHHPWSARHLVRPQLHRARLRARKGVRGGHDELDLDRHARCHLAPLAGRGYREAPGEGGSPRARTRGESPSSRPSPRVRGEGASHRYKFWWEGIAMENIAWMAWTLPTAIFFVLLAMTLSAMTWLAVAYPEAERVGVLQIPTTRGDRLFVSLILAAVIHLLWIGLFGTDTIATLPVGEGLELSSLWLATAISLVTAVIIFRTV